MKKKIPYATLVLIVVFSLLGRAFSITSIKGDMGTQKAQDFYDSRANALDSYVEGSRYSVYTQDLFLEPTLILYPALRTIGSFDVLLAHFYSRVRSPILDPFYPIYVLALPWFNFEIGLYQQIPKFTNSLLLLFLWLLNFPYWIWLSFTLKRFWHSKERFKKVLIFLFILNRSLFFLAWSLMSLNKLIKEKIKT